MANEAVLDRFVEAQAPTYVAALAEIRRGAKRSHWMWFIFPQFAGLGRSATAQFYGIASRAEALAYLDHPVLGARVVECVEALQDLTTSCGSACKKDPLSGVIGVQKGPLISMV